MSTDTADQPVTNEQREAPGVPGPGTRRRALGNKPGLSLLAQGEPMLWLTGGALALALLMIVGLLVLVMYFGLRTFWPLALIQVNTRDGRVYLGEVTRQDRIDLRYDRLEVLPEGQRTAARELLDPRFRTRLQTMLDEGRYEEQILLQRDMIGRAVLREASSNPQVQNAEASVRSALLAAVRKAVDEQHGAWSKALKDRLTGAVAADASGEQLNLLWDELKSAGPQWLTPARRESERPWDAGDWLLPQVWQKQALMQLSREISLPVRRRLFRTENFELTGTHFHWVSDFEIAADGETQPSWAVVVERLAGGRFYGTPAAFALRNYRTIPAREQALRQSVQFLEANQYRVSDAEEQATLAALTTRFREEYEAARRKNVAHFLQLWKNREGQRLDAIEEQGKAIPLGEATADQAITEVQQVWTKPADIWQQVERWHEASEQRREEITRIDEVDRGRVSRRSEEARLSLRRAEIDRSLAVVDRAMEMSQLQQELWALEKSRDLTARIVADLQKCSGGDAAALALVQRFGDALREENVQQSEVPRQRLRELEREVAAMPQAVQQTVRDYLRIRRETNEEDAEYAARGEELQRENSRYELRLVTAQQQDKAIELSEIVRAYPANRLSTNEKFALYVNRWGEFLSGMPREANSEGGVLPAIWGTVVMTLIMSLVVVPFGVLAALYLREYAKAGPMVSAVRISINNLAGVPSIVFGVFGLGFFCYIVGAYVDGGPSNAGLAVWPAGRWFIALSLLAVISVLAFLFSLFSLGARGSTAPRLQRTAGYGAVFAWLGATALFVLIVATTPFFGGWFDTNLPNPTFGKGGLMWSSLTLALLTLPVVIVATEEALSAVPNSLREGSYACGAGKWQTIRRIVLPHALPGIMTGMILAMARGAGEVAPLMLVGAVKFTRTLPIDTAAPFVHPDRSFMHLGFHIYDLGFQSQNSEAAKPMVFTTTLLLILIVAVLNISAVWLRSRLKKRFVSSAF